MPFEIAPCTFPTGREPLDFVNDAHCQFNRTRVGSVIEVKEIGDIQAAIARCRQEGWPLSMFGGRHCLGGQPFATDGLVLDMRGLNRVISLDETTGILHIQGGALWTDVRKFLASHPSAVKWEVHQKQTGADEMSVAGAMAVNAHGNPLGAGPISSDIEWLKVLDARGEQQLCSRETNADLFGLVLGGMGLFGAVTEIGLQLVSEQRFVRRSEVARVESVVDDWDALHAEYQYGDMQLDVNPDSPHFLKRGILNVWRTCDADTAVSNGNSQIKADWSRLITLAHVDKAQGFREYTRFAEVVNGSVSTGRDFHWDAYTNGYHAQLEQHLELPRGGDVLAEFFVPVESLPSLLDFTGNQIRSTGVDPILTTLRSVRQCQVSYLRWARRDYACMVMALHVDHCQSQLARLDAFCSAVARFCGQHEGTFYLPYRRFAHRDDLLQMYPNVREFLEEKLRRDPDGLFGSDWFGYLQEALSEEPVMGKG